MAVLAATTCRRPLLTRSRTVTPSNRAGKGECDPEPALQQVGLDPDRYLTRRMDKALSGGERHRIELASVLSIKPKLAILDEPAAGIDMLSINHIIDIIRALKASGGSVLPITHQEKVARIIFQTSRCCQAQWGISISIISSKCKRTASPNSARRSLRTRPIASR